MIKFEMDGVNHIIGTTTWEQVCRFSRKVSQYGFYPKGFESGASQEAGVRKVVYPELDLLVVATDSIGGRDWKVTGEPIRKEESFDGEFLFFKKDQVECVRFQSASSKAVVVANPANDGSGNWFIAYFGVDFGGVLEEGLPEGARESDYARIFLDLDFLGLEIQEVPYPSLLAKVR